MDFPILDFEWNGITWFAASTPGFFHSAWRCQGSSSEYTCQNFLSFWGWIIRSCKPWSFICRWLFGLFSLFGYCRLCCCEHSRTRLVWTYVFLSLGWIPRSGIAELQRSVANSVCGFLTVRLFSKEAALFHTLSLSAWGFWLFHIVSNICYYLFLSSHHHGCKVVSCSFELHFPND